MNKIPWITFIIFSITLFTFLFSCTEVRVKKIPKSNKKIFLLEPNKKLVFISWQNHKLWYLIRDMRPKEKPETYEFKDASTFGIFEFEIIIKERRDKKVSKNNGLSDENIETMAKIFTWAIETSEGMQEIMDKEKNGRIQQPIK